MNRKATFRENHSVEAKGLEPSNLLTARLETSVQRDSSRRVWAAQARCRVPGSSRPSSWKTAIQPSRVAPLVAGIKPYCH